MLGARSGLPQRRWVHLCGLCEVVVRHLGEQMVHYVGPNVVVDLVEDAVVPVDGGQASPEVAPLLRTYPRPSVLPIL